MKYRCNIARWLYSYHSLTDFKWPANSQSKARSLSPDSIDPCRSVNLSLQRSSANSFQRRRSKSNQVKFVLTQFHIPRRDVVDTSLFALELSFVCKAGIRKGNDRKILPSNPVSLEKVILQSLPCKASHNSIGVVQALNCWNGNIVGVHLRGKQDLAVHIGSPMPVLQRHPGQKSIPPGSGGHSSFGLFQLRLVSSSECCLGRRHDLCDHHPGKNGDHTSETNLPQSSQPKSG